MLRTSVNQLVSATPVTGGTGKTAVQFTYDYLGRRVNKNSLGWNATTSAYDQSWHHHYYYQGYRPIYDWTDNGQGGVWTTKTYVWGNDLSGSLDGAGGVGGILWMNSKTIQGSTVTDTSYAYAYDGNGNVRGIVKADAVTPTSSSFVEKYAYDGFGRELASSAPIAGAVNDIRFSTKALDVETGMNYYGLRYYASNQGRWINRDPIKENGGLNLYAQSANNITNAIDVLGNSWIKVGRKKGDGIFQDGYRMIWKRESDADTFAQLAEEVGLDPSEASKWATVENKDCNTYSVPNVFMQLRLGSASSWPGLGAIMMQPVESTYADKFIVSTSLAQASLYAPHLLGFSVYCHGMPNGWLVDSEWDFLPVTTTQPYVFGTAQQLNSSMQRGFKYNKIHLMYCYSGYKGRYFYAKGVNGEYYSTNDRNFAGSYNGQNTSSGQPDSRYQTVFTDAYFDWNSVWEPMVMSGGLTSYQGVNRMTIDFTDFDD